MFGLFFQTLLESMVDAAENLCPHVMRKTSLRQDLIKASMGKVVVPRSFVKNTLLEQSGIDIINKIRLNTPSVEFLKSTTGVLVAITVFITVCVGI